MTAPVSTDTLRRLAALNLAPDAMSEVLSIIADAQAADERRREGQRKRTREHRERVSRDGNRDCNVTMRDLQIAAATEQTTSDSAPSRARARAETSTLSSSEDPQESQEQVESLSRSTNKKNTTETLFRRKPTTALPDGYQLPETWRTYALSKGLTDQKIAVEFERFCNHAKQQDRRCSDWFAAWRNWVLAVPNFARTPSAPNGHAHGKSRPGGFARGTLPDIFGPAGTGSPDHDHRGPTLDLRPVDRS